ncbi:MAG: amidohydrolase family protein [Eggerthellaceae bacterium]|nr:amidohydrolase family protein [Eggerthellaceae bacterium]
MVIDAHQHFWKYNSKEFDWLEGELSVIQHDFLPENLSAEMDVAGVDRSIAVEARQSVEETDWLISLAKQNKKIAGIVAWLPINSPEFSELLDKYKGIECFNGIRHVVQDEPTGFLDDESFNAGIELMSKTDLIYEILIFEHQLDETIRFVSRHPNVSFVLDHIAKPRIGEDGMETWATKLRRLASFDNMLGCKMSGLVTEASEDSLTVPKEQLLLPYMEQVMEAFGEKRVMFGSDWPVLTPRMSYTVWKSMVEKFAGTSAKDIMGGNAQRIYKL